MCLLSVPSKATASTTVGVTKICSSLRQLASALERHLGQVQAEYHSAKCLPCVFKPEVILILNANETREGPIGSLLVRVDIKRGKQAPRRVEETQG